MSSRRAVLALVVLLLAGLCWVGLNTFERVSRTVDLGPAPEALENPYLAAERFLRGQGLTVHRSAQNAAWDHLQPGASSLLLLGDRRDMSPDLVQSLLAWVKQGGRVVVVGSGLWNTRQGRSGDLLLDTLKIRRSLADELPPAANASAAEGPDLTQLFLENESTPALFGFNPAFHLEDPTDKAVAWANSRVATHLMQLDWGDGVITVLSDGELWRNPSIGEYDNAWLLWYLNQDRTVTLVQRVTAEPWLTLLWRHFAPALLAGLSLLLAWCWYRGVRRGPVLPAPAAVRRQLAEHLHASARFTLRHGGHGEWLQLLRQDLNRQASRHSPGFNRLPVAEQWQVLARLAGVPTATVARAMTPAGDTALSSRAFTERVAELQRLRSAL